MSITKSRSILIINPNTTQSMTNALAPVIDKLKLTSINTTLFTAPTGPPSINNESDAAESTTASLPTLKPLLQSHDAFVVCCYSPHPLVPALRQELITAALPSKPVTGIFEASVATCLQLLSPEQKFGIVSTGSQWSEILDDAVAQLLGSTSSTRYAGTETTGLNATELHSTAKTDVDERMKEATKRLLAKGGVGAICLGCAGMAGMDLTVREACIEALGEVEGRRVRIVDGVVSGVLFVEGALRSEV